MHHSLVAVLLAVRMAVQLLVQLEVRRRLVADCHR